MMRLILIHVLACYTNYGITSFTICHSGLYGKIIMVSANRRTCLNVLGSNSFSDSGVEASGQERLNSSLGSRVAASGQEGLNSSSGGGVAASNQEGLNGTPGCGVALCFLESPNPLISMRSRSQSAHSPKRVQYKVARGDCAFDYYQSYHQISRKTRKERTGMTGMLSKETAT